MEVLILLTLVGILWLVSSRRWRRQVVKPIAILIIAYLIITSSLTARLATWGLTRFLPSDGGEGADAIVVLGRGDELRNSRIEVAHELWIKKRAPQVFVSGMMDARPIVDHLKEMGIPFSQLSGEECSQSTKENAYYTSVILYPQRVRKIVLVTDPPHMLRSLLLFQSFGFQVVPHPTSSLYQWSSDQQLKSAAREYLGLAHHWLAGDLKPRSISEIENPPAEVFQKFSEWKCKVQG